MTERDTRLENTIEQLAEANGLTASFSAGTRTVDLFVVTLRGDIRRTLGLYGRISEAFPELTLELLNDPDEDFGRVMALTLAANNEPLVVPQRRGSPKLGF